MTDTQHDTNQQTDATAHGHRWHWLGCAAMLAAALYLLLGGSPGGAFGASVGLAFLLCPIVMGAVVWLLLRTATPAKGSSSRSGDRT